MDGLRLFSEKHDDSYFLPRVFMHFDDAVGSERSMYNEFVGELAAIKDFNLQHQHLKIAENRVFRNYNLNFGWYHQSYIMHRFRHSPFSRYVSRGKPESLLAVVFYGALDLEPPTAKIFRRGKLRIAESGIVEGHIRAFGLRKKHRYTSTARPQGDRQGALWPVR
jgi:hypothetical protein